MSRLDGSVIKTRRIYLLLLLLILVANLIGCSHSLSSMASSCPLMSGTSDGSEIHAVNNEGYLLAAVHGVQLQQARTCVAVNKQTRWEYKFARAHNNEGAADDDMR